MSKPKYIIVKNSLKEQILAERYKINDRIPSESELSKLFSVSVHTIRQAVNQLVSEGYLIKIQGSGTYVSQRYLDSGNKQTKTIGLITTYVSEYIFPSIIRGIEEVLSQHNYSLLLASTYNDTKSERKNLEKMLNQNVDGLIVEPTQSSFVNPNLDCYLKIMQENKPLLMLHEEYDELSIPVIKMNDEKSGKMLTNYLIELGHRRIAIISKTDDKQGKIRLKGCLSALNQDNILFDQDYIITFETKSEDELSNKINEVLHLDDQPTAFVCYNDQVAIKVIEEIQKNGKNVPADYSVVSHDDSYLSTAIPSIHLTSAAHPKEEMGRRAAEWIINAVENKPVKSDTIIFEPELKIRNSTRNIEENN